MKLVSGLMLLILVAGNCWGEEMKNELKTVGSVDLSRYLGKWYEIAKYPNWFEKNLFGVTATYSLMKNGNVRVENAGKQGSLSGPEKIAIAKAWIADKNTNAKLKVQFFWPFAGNYWIIELGQDYEYAVIGESTRKYLWILCRQPQMPEQLYNELLKRIESHGYDLKKIEKMPQ